ncbi:mpv17-like protein [Ornithorhynchus anatinus]|uniref:mpv17-like protein n=1 Tax=Ornithorhynchus anatinus TaxID=9258 RepID=UPI0010A8C25D|nr:mpv17-like protein [Ornithorhynchus anatinus]
MGWHVWVRGLARRWQWPANVALYGSLFSAGDMVQQRLWGGEQDWQRTRCVALVAFGFQGHLNYTWLRLLEHALPGRRPRTVLAKVLCDQLLVPPVALSVFYTGMSILEGKEDIFLDLKQKFWSTYKIGLMYWPFVQLINFSLVPVYLRTAYIGICVFLWAIYLCYLQQSGEDTAPSTSEWPQDKKTSEVENTPEK